MHDSSVLDIRRGRVVKIQFISSSFLVACLLILFADLFLDLLEKIHRIKFYEYLYI